MTSPPSAVRPLLAADPLILGPREPDPTAVSAGRQVVLLADRPGARSRLRARARRLDLRITAEFVVIPSLRSALLVVQDEPAVLDWAWRSTVTVPPGVTRASVLVDLLVRAGSITAVRHRLGGLVPGRVLLGVQE
ncbi:MAG: hypothetical protein WA962_06170 [Ornithinimicrobium sp.]